MKRLRINDLRLKIFLSSLFVLFSIHQSLIINPAFAATPCVGNISPSLGDCPAGLNELENVFKNVVTVSVYLGFIALLVMLVIAGFKYITSSGDQKAISSAHNTAQWALMGLLFLAGAWLMLQLLAAFTGIEALKTFDVQTLPPNPSPSP